MNKGIAHASGDYLLFLNSGDYLSDDNVLKDFSMSLSNKDIVYGDLFYIDNNSVKILTHYPDELDFDYFMESSLPHPASFIKRSLFVGSMYTESLNIVSDWEFFFRKIVFESVSYLHVSRPVSVFNTNGISSNLVACNKERDIVFNKLFPQMLYPVIMSYHEWKNQPLFPLYKEYIKTRRLQRRVKPLLKVILKLHRLFSKKGK